MTLSPYGGMGPFHWHLCEACKRAGYRKDKGGGLDRRFIEPMHLMAVAWHGKIAAEMWEDFISISTTNLVDRVNRKDDHT